MWNSLQLGFAVFADGRERVKSVYVIRGLELFVSLAHDVAIM